jgi:hypothetical protein
MSVNEKLRSRYLQDSIPVRLGGLAANLARISSFSKNEGNQDAVSVSLQESKWFIEWTAGELDTQVADTLVRLQIQLAVWQIQSQEKWDDPKWRFELNIKTEEMSQRILKMSGLLNSTRV